MEKNLMNNRNVEAVVRETKRRTLSLIHEMEYKTEEVRMKGILENYDPSDCEQVVPEKVKTIAFIITRMVRFHGGQTSVLHLGTELSKLGYKVIYLSYKQQSREEMEICAGSNLADYKGKVSPLKVYRAAIDAGKCKEPDVVVATSWDTVSFAKKFTKSYKMYFVQDYEPYFYKFGEEFLMAKSTYDQGLHMVSLGAWNKAMIERECGENSERKLDVISFPYEKQEYPRLKREYTNYMDKKKIKIAVYMKYYGKRLPNLIPYMLKNTAAKFEAEGIEVEVLYFGEAKTFKSEGGRNLGQLKKDEMLNLYRECDFGMVASMSNISLVPFEMHSVGLPLIEFSDGTYPYFFRDNTAILTRIGKKDIYDELKGILDDPSVLIEMQNRADEDMEKLSWTSSAKEFADILERIHG